MNPTVFWSCLACMGSISLISLASSHLYRKEPLITAELMSLVSFAPGFIFGGIAIFRLPFHFDTGILTALLVKNVLYCLSFYFRYESLRMFGPFVGALMLGTQPIIVFLFGLILLGESITVSQGISVILVVLALFLLANRGRSPVRQTPISLIDFGKYYAFPTIASTLAIVWDRYFLKDMLPSREFFVLDRVAIVPAFFITLVLIRRRDFTKVLWNREYVPIFDRNWKMLALVGLLFTFSVYTYNLALEGEKAAVVGLFRNASYPIAAFAGAFIFRHKISNREWFCLSLILLAISLGLAGP